VIGIAVAVIDISERKKSEQALRESEEHLKNMVERTPRFNG
jgi:PAS domain-containing protein